MSFYQAKMIVEELDSFAFEVERLSLSRHNPSIFSLMELREAWGVRGLGRTQNWVYNHPSHVLNR